MKKIDPPALLLVCTILIPDIVLINRGTVAANRALLLINIIWFGFLFYCKRCE